MKTVFSGQRPTGKLHIGHYLGTLVNWARLQDENSCYFMVADLHALTTAYAKTAEMPRHTLDMVLDWLAAGIDPERSVVFKQSDVPEHSELALIFGMVTPLSWLYRVPTYKDQIEQLGQDIATHGFLGYPVLQAADIALYKGELVPVGEDQVAHLELSREIVRRFNSLYGETFPEPQALLTASANVKGLDGRKMSKSYDNAIALSDDEETTEKKVMSMFTDPERKRRDDPGDPDICNVFGFQKLFNGERVAEISAGCRDASFGCVECKREMAERLNEALRPLRERRRELVAAGDGAVVEVLRKGAEKARETARVNITETKGRMNLTL